MPELYPEYDYMDTPERDDFIEENTFPKLDSTFSTTVQDTARTIMHTHPSITHPALRHRMAVALNQLRHKHRYSSKMLYRLSDMHSYSKITARVSMRESCERMAALEQELDIDQEARIFGQPTQIN